MEFSDANLIAAAAIAVTLVAAIVAGIMFTLGSQRLHYLWGIFCGFAALWSVSFFFVTQAQTVEAARLWWKIAYIGIIMSPVIFFHFILEFVKKRNQLLIGSVYVIGWTLVFIAVSTNLIVDQMRHVFGFYYDSPAATLQPLTLILYAVLVAIAHVILFKAYRESTDLHFKQRIEYFFLATSIGFFGSGLNFLPVYGIDVNPITLTTLIISWPLIGYTILRYGLFNIRIVTAQLLTLALTIFAFVQIIFSDTRQEFIFNSAFLFVVFGVGVYLIRSVGKEVEQREEIERLAKDLRVANERLKELDKLKSQFLSIASHDLRAPLTTVRNFMSLLLDGTYGKLPDAAEEGMRRVFDQATDMAESVENYLNVSRIEQGRMKYEFEKADLVKVLSETTEPFKSIAEQKGLSFTFRGPADLKPILIKADVPKLHETFRLLIDNSIKYTPKGSVNISVEKKEKIARVIIKDTGVGISKETMPKLFKLFSTDEHSRKVNTSSTGVGLYVVKAHIEAHKGKVWVESDGEGKGSSFIVEVPTLLS